MQLRRVAETVPSCFDEVSGTEMFFFLTLGVSAGVLYAVSQYVLLQLLLAGAMLFAAIKNPFYCLGVYMATSIYISEIYPGIVHVGLLALICISFFFHNISIINRLINGSLLIFSFLMILASYLLGFESKLTTGILLFLCVLIYVLIVNNYHSTKLGVVVWAIICGAIGVSIYLLMKSASGSVTKFGRLSFEGDIKTVSVIMVTPMMLLLISRLTSYKLIRNLDNSLFEWVCIAVFGVVLILTVARGIMIAAAIGVLFSLFLARNKMKWLQQIIPIIALVFVFIMLNIDSEEFRISRLFETEEYTDMNGRTDIWLDFVKDIVNRGPASILFGIGPGSVSRISEDGLYSHSTYLDYFFSYGSAGLLWIFVFTINVVSKVWQSKIAPLICLLCASIIMYMTHGSAANVEMYIIQGLIVATVTRKNNECRI